MSSTLSAFVPGAASALELHAAGSADVSSRPTPPPQAAGYGFHELVFSDDFDSIRTIDVNNSLQPGFNWYMANAMIPQDSPDGNIHTGVVQAPSSVSVANSILTFTPSAPSGGYLTNVGYKGASGKRTVGVPIAAGGFYLECRMAFNPNFIPTHSTRYPFQYWPGFWMEDIDLWLAINDRNTARVNRAELDGLEVFGPASNYAMEVHDWRNNIDSVELLNNVAFASFGSPNFSAQNVYGTRCVSQAKNHGIGTVDRYFNNKEISAAHVDYSASATSAQAGPGAFPGVFSDLDTSAGFVLQVGSGHNWPVYVDWIKVWQ